MLNHLRTIFSAAPLMMHRFNGPTLPTATNASHALATASSTETAIFANGWSVPLASLHSQRTPEMTS